MENQSFFGYVADVKKRAEGLISAEHVGEDVRVCLRDLLKVVENFHDLKTDSVSAGADARLYKKRFDQSKSELRAAEKRIEALKGTGYGLLVPAKQLAAELSSVKDPVVVARMQAAIKKIGDSLIEISKI